MRGLWPCSRRASRRRCEGSSSLSPSAFRACQNIRALAEQNPLRGERQTPAGLEGGDLLPAAAPCPGARCLLPPALAALPGHGHRGCCRRHRVPFWGWQEGSPPAGGGTGRCENHISFSERRLSEPQITSEVIAVAISCLLCVRGRAVYTGSCFALPVQTVSFNKGRGKPKNILGV